MDKIQEIRMRIYEGEWKHELQIAKDASVLMDEVDRLNAELAMYKAHSKSISALNNCNNCAISKICSMRPKWREQVRINCFLWSNGNTKQSD